MITKILCLSDGRPGNQRPVELLGTELSKYLHTEPSHLIVQKTPWRNLGNQLESMLLGLAPKPISDLVKGLKAEASQDVLVITCGRTALPYGRFLKRRHRVKLVHILNPYGNVKQFDAVVLPKHDLISGPNIVQYRLGLTQKPKADDEALSFMEKLPQGSILALVVGGSNAHQHISPENIQMWKTAITKNIPDLAGLAITFSRRTQPDTKKQVLEAFAEYPCCFYDGNGPNPYPGFLALASHAAVTIDSMNMLADVAASECPMMLLPVSGSQPKFASVIENLVAHKRAGLSTFGGDVTSWDELPKVAQMVKPLLLGEQANNEHKNDGTEQ